MPATPAARTFPYRTQVFTALATGLGTTAYYATPDLIAGRRARGWVKAGLAAVTLAASIPAARTELPATREAVDEVVRANPEAEATEDRPGVSGRGVAVAALLGGALVLGATAASVAIEKWIFRRGEARAVAGKALPHTGPALLYGALTAAAGLVPLPEPEGTRPTPR